MGAPLVRRTVEVQATAVPGPEAASGVPSRRPIPVGVATGPLEAPPAGQRPLAAVARGAVAGVPTTLFPTVVVAATTTEATGLVPGARRLGAALTLEAKANTGALRGPRGPVRAAAAASRVPTATVAPPRVPRVRGVAPTAGVAVPTTPSPIAEAATAPRRRPTAPRAPIGAGAPTAPLAATVAGTPRQAWRVRLASVATDAWAATTAVPTPGGPAGPGVAAVAAHAPGVPTPTVTGPLPVGKAGRLAAKVAPGQGVVAPSPTAIRPRVLGPSWPTAAALPTVPAEDSGTSWCTERSPVVVRMCANHGQKRSTLRRGHSPTLTKY